tara:strand:+ start:488 stop:991 length:504 start_codon:yes stop_codon:yes gene_type:complete
MKLFLILSLLSFNIFAQDLMKSSGGKISLKDFKGKPILVVNIATQCGYTKQLENLQKLHKKYESKGLVVIGVPSNDFGGQTPESDIEVKKFCKLNYGATYTIAKKTTVKGKKKDSFFQSLIDQDGGKEISWNFEKFLLGKDGKLLKRFRSSVKPDSKEITSEIEKML